MPNVATLRLIDYKVPNLPVQAVELQRRPELPPILKGLHPMILPVSSQNPSSSHPVTGG